MTAPALGYDADFLGIAVPLPAPPASVVTVVLPYVHFSVLLRPDRRLAAATGVNLDGAALLDLDRAGEQWLPDPRAPLTAQTDDGLYERNDLDRGHLVRRRDPVWGTAAEAAQANSDTFRFPNCAPQAAQFNQGKELWLGLEDYLLGRAAATGRRLSVFTGPVLSGDDPVYRGVGVPRLFWKVAAWAHDGELAATAYLLDQGELIDRLMIRAAGGQRDLVGAFRTFQVPVAEVAEVTGLDVGPLLAADRLEARQALETLSDMTLAA